MRPVGAADRASDATVEGGSAKGGLPPLEGVEAPPRGAEPTARASSLDDEERALLAQLQLSIGAFDAALEVLGAPDVEAPGLLLLVARAHAARGEVPAGLALLDDLLARRRGHPLALFYRAELLASAGRGGDVVPGQWPPHYPVVPNDDRLMAHLATLGGDAG